MGDNIPKIPPPPPPLWRRFKIPPCDPLDIALVVIMLIVYILNMAHHFVVIPNYSPTDYKRDLSGATIESLGAIRWFMYFLGMKFSLMVFSCYGFLATQYKYVFRKSLLFWAALDCIWEMVDLIVWDNRHDEYFFFVEQGIKIGFFILLYCRFYKWSIYRKANAKMEDNSAYICVYPPRNIKTFLGSLIGMAETGRVKFLINLNGKNYLYGKYGSEYYHEDKCKNLIKFKIKDLMEFYLHMDELADSGKGSCISKYKEALKKQGLKVSAIPSRFIRRNGL